MRDIAAIEADLKGVEGVAGQGNKIGKLRKELIVAQSEKIADLENSIEMLAVDISLGPAEGASIASPAVHPESEEWAFVQQACAELKPPQSGSSAGLVKWAFNDLDARVKNWRVARALITKLGVGAVWPQYTALGICHRTGIPEHDHSVLGDDWDQEFCREWVKNGKPQNKAALAAMRENPDSRESKHVPPGEPVWEMPENVVPLQGMPAAPGDDAVTADNEAEKVRALMGAQIDAKGEPVLE